MASLAPALARLRTQVDADAPDRSPTHDGWIGDAAHTARKSDHNPDQAGVVHALDLTDDDTGTGGARFDVTALADTIVASRDPRVRYLIHRRRIISGPAGPHPWTWRPYTGPNGHTTHLHVSVRRGSYARDTRDWSLPVAIEPPLNLPEVYIDHGPQLTGPASLTPGGRLTSAAGHVLALQRDGNVVLYDPAGRPCWSTGRRGDTLTLQRDGNLVLYRRGLAVWSSGTAAPTHTATLILRDDGHLILRADQDRWAAP